MSKWRGGVIRSTQITPGGSDETAAASGVWRASDAAYWVKQGQWPTPTPIDPYFPYNTLLLNGDGLQDARNNTFVDSSSVYSPVIRNGNPTQGSFSPYGSNWSNYFDGSGDNLSLSGNSAFSIASSSTPFTIEGWIYPTAAGGCIFSESYTGAGDTVSISVIMADGSTAETNGQYVTFGFYNGSAWSLTRANTQVSLNAWTHIACVFTGSTSKIYYNGVDVTASSPITSWGVTGDAGDAWYVGQRWDTTGTAYFRGFISNLRFVNGTAVYTSAFTPPTSPLIAISGTALLTCQSNRFRDASSNNFTTTRNGDARVSEFSPFSTVSRSDSPFGYYNQNNSVPNWSNYFDGNGDYLSWSGYTAMDFGSAAFTVEAWVYLDAMPTADSWPTSWSSHMVIVTVGSPSTGDGTGFLIGSNRLGFHVNDTTNWSTSHGMTAGQWYHVAVSRSSNTLYFFVNGVAKGTATLSGSVGTGTGTYIACETGQGAYLNGYISNLRCINGTALYTSAFTPPTSALTAVSGTSLLTCQSPTFADNSTNRFAITVNGDTKIVGFSPLNTAGYHSVYFDGSGDYLSLTNNTGLGSNNFTIEFWGYNITGSSNWGVFSLGAASGADYAGITMHLSGGIFISTTGSSWQYADVGGLTLGVDNQWHHYAIVRNGSSLLTFKDGVLIATTSIAGTLTNRNGLYEIGKKSDGSGISGYISNFRVVNGTALYTSSFTPSTTPLTAVTNTSLLICQSNSLVDNSSNAFAITRNGDAKVQTFSPFSSSTSLNNTGSMYFDGSGDYLTSSSSFTQTIGTSNFTYEMWVYPLSIPTYSDASFLVDNRNQINFCIYLASNALWFYNGGTEYNGGTVNINAWNHLVICRSSGTTRGFVNGVQAFSFADSSNYGQMGQFVGARYTGATQYLNGYISNLRFMTGTALYTSAFTPPTSPVLPTSNTKFQLEGMNAAIADLSGLNNLETGGTARVNTSIKKYGSGSMYFDGSSWLYTPSKPENFFRTGNFTIEGWFYYLNASTNVDNGMFGNYLSGWGTDTIYWGKHTTYGGKVALWVANYSTGGAMLVDPNLPPANTWVHYAVVRNGNTWTMYRDGTSVATQTYSGDPMLLKGDYVVGRADATAQYFYGYMDEFRISKYARYTSNFTPSTTTLPIR